MVHGRFQPKSNATGSTAQPNTLAIIGFGLAGAGLGALLGHLAFHKPWATVIGGILFTGVGAYGGSKIKLSVAKTALQTSTATADQQYAQTQATAEQNLQSNTGTDAQIFGDISATMGQ